VLSEDKLSIMSSSHTGQKLDDEPEGSIGVYRINYPQSTGLYNWHACIKKQNKMPKERKEPVFPAKSEKTVRVILFII
jgi:hypothetical protein